VKPVELVEDLKSLEEPKPEPPRKSLFAGLIKGTGAKLGQKLLDNAEQSAKDAAARLEESKAMLAPLRRNTLSKSKSRQLQVDADNTFTLTGAMDQYSKLDMSLSELYNILRKEPHVRTLGDLTHVAS